MIGKKSSSSAYERNGQNATNLFSFTKLKPTDMKKIIITLSICLIIILGFGQTKERELSNAEKFSAKAGTLIQKEFIEVGTIKGAKISIIQFTDLILTTKQSA